MGGARLALPSVTVSAVLAGLGAIGMPTEELVQRAGITQHQLDDPQGVVPDAAFEQLWRAAFAHNPQPDLPLRAGLATPFGAFGLLDHLVASSQTVGEGLQTLRLFFRLVSPTITLDLTHDDGDWLYLVNTPSTPADSISDQWTIAIIIQRFAQAAHGFAVHQIHLTQPAVVPADVYTKHVGLHVVLNQPRSGVQFAAGSWLAPLQTTNPTLHATLRSLAERVEVRAFTDDPLGYVIRQRLPEAVRTGQFSPEEMAAQLGIPLRTLQRRLSEQQVTFKQLLDAYRQEEAQRMLQQRDLSVAEIAYNLGYTEQSSFNRAFKRWTGLAPTVWAAQIR